MFSSVLQCVASFVFYNVLGWTFKQDISNYFHLRSDHNIILYVHTSMAEGMLCVLMSLICEWPGVSIGKQAIANIPIVGYFLHWIAGCIYINNNGNNNIVQLLSDDLNMRDDFVLGMSPEGSRALVDRLRSGYYYIAKKTNANLYCYDIDFVNHTVDLIEIASKDIIQTVPYDEINGLTEEIFKKQNPYDYRKCHLTKDNPSKTSFLNMRRSILQFIPVLVAHYLCSHGKQCDHPIYE